MEKICVAVRLRPSVSDEAYTGTFWKLDDDNRISLHRSQGTPISGVSYAFDHVFDETCSNATVYEVLTKDIIRAALEGFNGTAFAYGQTSSGKTFTMNGSEKDPGIIHRAVEEIFERIQMMSDREFLIRVSYMEIYNEEINDLFTMQNQKMQIHESLDRGVFVAGLREEVVNNAEQVLKLLESGEANRHFGETNMNIRSSRSHTIFRMVIESKGKDASSFADDLCSDAIRVSVLNLVDLAGSERIAKTGAGGVRLKEGKHINKSLMVLGNVINKLSDGPKNRGHIPYRDSKLTRILQPALGGNAKTSIICTIAPEEVHVEETKGTLQFASRAKRIANCVQVNEILTDGALLKRQKLEIEELRKKLQGSHAEVLEQEILKLRNDLLKYEFEREKLEIELQEQRKSHKERDHCIKEQKMKIENLSNLITSETDRSSSHRNLSGQHGTIDSETYLQGQDCGRCNHKGECSDSNSVSKGDPFMTPSFKAAPNAFVAKRSNYSALPDFSPLPDTLSHVADEDTWLKMNGGYIADLDSLQITPSRKVQSFPPSEATPGCTNENFKQEVKNLKRQLDLAIQERDEFKSKHMEQMELNKRLEGKLSELLQEARLIQEIPQRLFECTTNCKDIYVDLLSTTQGFIPDGKSSNAKLLSSMSEIGVSLFTILESHLSSACNGHNIFTGNDVIQQEHKVLCEKMKITIKSLVSSESLSPRDESMMNSQCRCEHKDCALEGKTVCWKESLSNDLSNIKERYSDLERELDLHSQLLKESKQRFNDLDANYHHLKEERDSLSKMAFESSQKLFLVNDQKENVLKDLNTECQRRKDLEEKIKQFSVAFAHRKTSLVSFHNEFRSKIEKLRTENPVSTPNAIGS